jgi:hypothetical protein
VPRGKLGRLSTAEDHGEEEDPFAPVLEEPDADEDIGEGYDDEVDAGDAADDGQDAERDGVAGEEADAGEEAEGGEGAQEPRAPRAM